MRILYVLTSLGMGGAEKLSLALCERMKQRGHTAALLLLKPPVKEEWPTDAQRLHLDIGPSRLSFLRGLVRGRRFAADFQPDLIHSHCFHANVFARCLRVPTPRRLVISTIHNVYEGGFWRMLAYRLTDGLSRQTVAVSAAAARRFVQLNAVPAQKCSVIVNGIDVREFARNAERRARTRAEGACAAGRFLWLAAGRIAPAKDYPNLLRAFAQVRASRPDARLWIAGESAGTALSSLQSLTAELNLCDSIQWLGLRRDMPALLDAADGFVSASAWEGMPLSVGEAMAMEKPVVATDVGGVRELVGAAGHIVPSHDSEALAAAMCAAMDMSSEARCALCRAARSRIEQHFSMDANADRWEALYNEALAERKSRVRSSE